MATNNPSSSTGALFRPSNLSARQANTNEDICFVLRKAVFKTGSATFDLYSLDRPLFEYDNLKLKNASVTIPGITDIVMTASYTNIAGDYSTFDPILTNTPYKLNERKVANAQSDIAVTVTLTNNSKDITPIFDFQKTSAIAYRNQIDPYDLDTSASELLPSSGVSKAKYISKLVQLMPDFDSTGIRVRMDVNRKTGTDIEVFCKVISAKDTTNPLQLPWKKMKLISNGGVKTFNGLSEFDFSAETYELLDPNLRYSTTITTGSGNITSSYTDFDRYAIKVVFYSYNEPFIPKIKNLYATSVV
jgi:hypothetical protein